MSEPMNIAEFKTVFVPALRNQIRDPEMQKLMDDFLQSYDRLLRKLQILKTFRVLEATATFIPPREAASTEPTLTSDGELKVWRDTDDGKVYLLYKDADSGQKKIELT